MSKHFKAFVDRFEGEYAVILIGNDGYQILLPSENLPEDTKEGCVVDIAIQVDNEATKAAENSIEELIDRLKRGA